MGICLSHLPFYDLCQARKAIQSPVFALGSQEIHEPQSVILQFAQAHGYHNLARDGSARSLFRDRYHVGEYCDCDLNGRADLVLDLNEALPASLYRKAMTILDAGTMEHVFDIARALQNIHRLLAPGGLIMHVAPLSWFEHGFYNFNPHLFRAIADANGYRMVVEAFHFVHDPLNIGEGGTAKCHITFDGCSFTALREEIFALLRAERWAANALYMVAYSKTQDGDFKSPYDVQG